MGRKTTRLFSVMNEKQLKEKGFKIMDGLWTKVLHMESTTDENGCEILQNEVSIIIAKDDKNGEFTNQINLWVSSWSDFELAEVCAFDDILELLQDGMIRFITKTQLFDMQQKKYTELFNKWQAYAENKKKTLNFWDPASDREFSRIEYQMKQYKPNKELLK